MLGIGLGVAQASLQRHEAVSLAAPDWIFIDGIKTGIVGSTYVIYGGHDLRLGAAGSVESAIASAVAALPGGANYLVIGLPTFDVSDDYAGAAGHEAVLTINANLDETYGIYWGGGSYVDFREHFVQAYVPTDAQDVIDYGRDIIPSSLRSGATAFSPSGVSAINDWIASIISEKGW